MSVKCLFHVLASVSVVLFLKRRWLKENCDNLPPLDALTAFLMEFYPLHSFDFLFFFSLFVFFSVHTNSVLRHRFISFVKVNLCRSLCRFYIHRSYCNTERNVCVFEEACRLQLTKMTLVSLEMISLEILK